MKISITKMKIVIDELQGAELEYKKQLAAFEKVSKEYKSLNQGQQDKLPWNKVLEDLNCEYRSIKQLRTTLTEIVRCYEKAEANIIKDFSSSFGSSVSVKPIAIEEVQNILKEFNIKFL